MMFRKRFILPIMLDAIRLLYFIIIIVVVIAVVIILYRLLPNFQDLGPQ